MAPLPLALAGARLRAARGRQLALALALGLAVVIPIVVGASSEITARAALARALDRLPAGERSVTVPYGGQLSADRLQAVDSAIRRELGQLVSGSVTRELEFREFTDGQGGSFVLSAADGLSRYVRLADGRLPEPCTPTRCEVVVEKPPGTADPGTRTVPGLVIVGHAVRTDPLFLTATFAPPAGVPVLLADGVPQAAALPALALIQPAYGWVAPLDAAAVEAAGGVEGWIDRATAAADRLALVQGGVQLDTPEDTLVREASRSRESASRFGLLAGSCAVLLLAGAIAGGAALRPDQVRFVAAMRRRGLASGPMRAVVAAETFALSLAGAVLGLAGGTLAALVMAAVADAPAGAVTGAALRSALPEVAGLTLAAWVLLMVTLWPASRPGWTDPRTAWRFVSAAIVAGVVAVLLVVSRGGVAASGSSDPLVVLLPALLLLTVGLITARLWPVAVRVAYQRLPRRASGARLGVAGISARPLLAAPAAGLLAAAVGASCFAASYRATLLNGAEDQAAFAVPLDARIVPGPSQIVPLASSSVAGYAATAPGGRAWPVLRQTASVRSGPRTAAAVPVLGLDPGVLADLRRFSRVTGGDSAETLARSLPATTGDDARALPAGRTLTVAVLGDPPAVVLNAALRATDGTERTVPLQASPAATATLLSGPVPPVPAGTDGWHLVSLSVQQSYEEATRYGHVQAEGQSAPRFPSGHITFGSIMVDRAGLAQPWAGFTGAGLKPTANGAGATLDYTLTTGALVLHGTAEPAGSAGASQPLPVIADPATARSGPLLTLSIEGIPVRARVVATLPRMATVPGPFLVSDVRALSALVDWVTPGSGQPGEIWLSAPPGSVAAARQALADPPFAALDVDWASDQEHALRTDPVASGAIGLLVLAAALTLLVALAALVLLVVSERFEDADELLSWEADGVAPGVLRRGLWVRAALVAVVGVPIGVVCGLLLTVLTSRLVGLTAGADLPSPPLIPETGVAVAVPVVLVALAATLAVAGLVAAGALRESRPVTA